MWKLTGTVCCLAIVFIVGATGCKKSTPPNEVPVANKLLSGLRSSDAIERKFTAESMAGMQWVPADCVEPLVDMLKEPNHETRLCVAKALMFVNPEIRPHIGKIEQAYNREVNEEVRQALGEALARANTFK